MKKQAKEEIYIENPETKKPKKKKHIVRKIFLVIFIILLILGVYFGYKVYKNGGGLQGFLATIVGHNEETLKNMPKIYFVVMGESNEVPLTDTIMLCSYDPKNQEASILSIPRDTYVGKNKNTATSYNKINAKYNAGKNPEATVEAISQITGIDLKYYVLINTKALRELVDKIGGVWFDVPIDMKYDDYSQKLHINLSKGYQQLDGSKAEQVVRFRHNNNGSTYDYEYGQEDIGRMKTQRDFIKAVLVQTLKKENIFKIGEFLDIAHNNVKTNIELSYAKDYIPYAVNFNSDNLKTGTLPGNPEFVNEVWIYSHDKEETTQLVKELFLASELPAEDAIKVEVLNGTSNEESLTNLIDKLKENGYNVTKQSNTSATSKTVIINRTQKTEEIQNTLKDLVGNGSLSSGENNAEVDFTIIIGSDYK